MPFTSFTANNTYAKSTYDLFFDINNMYVRVKSTGRTFATFLLTTGVDIRINNSNIEVGTINGLTGNFTRDTNCSQVKWGILYDESLNKVIGTSDTSDTNVTKHNYIIGQSNTPIRIKKTSSTNVRFTCPCDLENCSTLNSGYTQVN